MLIIITNIVKYTLLYTVDTVKYSMNTEDILEELTKVYFWNKWHNYHNSKKWQYKEFKRFL